MGIERNFDALSGYWSGQYWLSDTDQEGVRFSAWLSIENDRLNGSTLEPRLFDATHKKENEATLRGHISPDEVVFLKTYKGVDHEPGYYEGELSECRQHILGRWYFGWPDEVSGRFEMTFKSTDKAPALERAHRAKTLED
ncbi:MAG: hypothetical protein AAGL97_00655 [Pseudomonadota bacterium]